jgi:16S rRNA (guanine966-N2)-methyltransferase
MRIIGGNLKGRVFKGPISDAIRPTSDRLRETIFDILMNSFPEKIAEGRVLDIFSGTGAIAIEALSRGASMATLVDESAKAAALIRENLVSLKLEKRALFIRRDARKLGLSPSGPRHDFAFLDPPYGKGLIPQTLVALRDGKWLKPSALIVTEEAKAVEFALPDGFSLLKTRLYGDTKLIFAKFEEV